MPDRDPLYAFDEADAELTLVPTAARRALDAARLRLSLDGWKSLDLRARRALVEAGAAPTVAVAEVARLVAGATPAARVDEEGFAEPGALPEALLAALGASRPLDEATWRALRPLDRYAFAKVLSRGKPERLARTYDEIVGASALSTHLSARGEARMVDVGAKAPTARRAVATASVRMKPETLALLASGDAPKGDALAVARVAGIQAAKRTPDLIPLCHAIALTRVEVAFTLDAAASALRVRATAEAVDRTGVEMEAMVAASVAALTVYDMLKGRDRWMAIAEVALVEKSGGRSGDVRREPG